MHVGVDVGGTKTHIVAVADGTVRFDVTLPTAAWRSRTNADADAAALVLEVVRQAAGDTPEVLVVGSHGCDSDAECTALQQRLAALLPSMILVLNDSELLLPAAGKQDGISVIAGTGSIAVSRDGNGAIMASGGWGWFLGDEGSASGIVRDAARAMRASLDRGEALDALGQSLVAAIGVGNPAEIGHGLVKAGSAARIGSFCPLVFAAADAGSVIAQAVIDESGRALAETVLRLIERGARGNTVIAGGGVITRQPRLMRVFSTALLAMAPDWDVAVLREPPVTGAIVLAAKLARGEAMGRLPQPHAAGKPQQERERRAI
ncbi:N-acetylglucosamine kinase [Rhizobium laguerreae]|nr:N-acetylglucosamine kinase [Rhizobium laguerreae]